MAQDRAIFTMADQYFILFYLFILFYFIIIIYYLFYFSNSVKCPCNVIHDSVTLIFTFLIIIIIIIHFCSSRGSMMMEQHVLIKKIISNAKFGDFWD